MYGRYTVVGYTKYSHTQMTFHTIRGDKVELRDGNADLLIGDQRHQVCSADVTCSAFKVEVSQERIRLLVEGVLAHKTVATFSCISSLAKPSDGRFRAVGARAGLVRPPESSQAPRLEAPGSCARHGHRYDDRTTKS